MALLLAVLREKMGVQEEWQKRQKSEGRRHTILPQGTGRPTGQEKSAALTCKTSGQHADLHPTCRLHRSGEPSAQSQPRKSPSRQAWLPQPAERGTQARERQESQSAMPACARTAVVQEPLAHQLAHWAGIHQAQEEGT